MARTVSALVSLLVLSCAAACGSPRAVGPPLLSTGGAAASRTPTVLLFGDSLTTESGDMVTTLLEDEYEVEVGAVGGTALCDAIGAIDQGVVEHRPSLVVVQFSGNAMTPCMRPRGADPSPSEYIELYRAAAETVIDELSVRQVALLIVGSPPKPEDVGRGPSTDDALREVAEISSQNGRSVTFVDAGRAVAGPTGAWTATLPCLAFENAAMGCVDGRIAVRSQDRGHFCPGEWDGPDGQIPRCQLWSSGAFRYASAISRAVRDALDHA